MTSLRITIAGREYVIACDDGQEAHLRKLAQTLDSRLKAISAGAGKTSDMQLLVLAALMLTDEVSDATRDLAALRHDIQNSSQSFERSKQIEMENAIATTIDTIAGRVEAIADTLEAAQAA